MTLLLGDCLEMMTGIADCSIDAVCTDPPYGINFMGKAWDGAAIEQAAAREAQRDFAGVTRLTGSADSANRGVTQRTASGFANRAGEAGAYDFTPKGNRAFQAWCETWGAECLRVLKPGGHMLVFGGTRTYHRMAAGLEDAGFEIRDTLSWNFGSGFPKSLDVGKDARFCQCEVELGADGDSYLRSVRSGVHTPSEPLGASEASNMQSPLQRQVSGRGLEEARPQGTAGEDRSALRECSSEDDRAEESGVEGRSDIQTPEGELRQRAVCTSASMGVGDGEEGWLCDGAPSRDGNLGRATAEPNGGGPSLRPRSIEQLPIKSSAVAGQPEPQTGRTWEDCGRCGKPICPGGLGTALKPAYEPIVLARKPFRGTVAANVLEHGTGALNIDATRILFESPADQAAAAAAAAAARLTVDQNAGRNAYGSFTNGEASLAPYLAGMDKGRWPANVLLDEEAAEMVDAQSGQSTSTAGQPRLGRNGDGWGMTATGAEYDDIGGASRFFYCAKVSRAERAAGCENLNPAIWTDGRETPADNPCLRGTQQRGNHHPTVKPIDLMRYLIRLITPPDGTVLDPFLGSGTTGIAAHLERVNFIGIEREPDYMRIAEARLAFWTEHGQDGLRICAERDAAERLRTERAAAGQLALELA